MSSDSSDYDDAPRPSFGRSFGSGFSSDDGDEGLKTNDLFSKQMRYRGVSFAQSKLSKYVNDDAESSDNPDRDMDAKVNGAMELSDIEMQEEAKESEMSTRIRTDFQSYAETEHGRDSVDTARSAGYKTSFLAARNKPSTKSRLGGSYGLGEKLLAKMGYVEGQGLGTDGRGIVNPIEQKLRPERLGLGGVKEKTKQAVREERRRAGMTTDITDDEQEVSKVRNRSEPKRTMRSKVTYKTIEEIEGLGLPVPSYWKNIIDMRGIETKVVEDMKDIVAMQVPDNEEAEKARMAELARRDLEMYANEWENLQSRRKHIDKEEERIRKLVDDETLNIDRLSQVMDIVKDIGELVLNISKSDPVYVGQYPPILEDISKRLEKLQFQYPNEVEHFKLDDVAIASTQHILRKIIMDWNPLSEPTYLKDYFTRWRTILRIDYHSEKRKFIETKLIATRRATLFESMLSEIWLPRVRSALYNDWNVYKPTDLIILLEEWKEILPHFIVSQLLEQVVLPRINLAVSNWDPRSSQVMSYVTPAPHLWIFPWMPYLGSHLKPIVSDIRRKYNLLMSNWDISHGTIDGLDEWREVFDRRDLEKMTEQHIYPKLVNVLRIGFQVNPSDQDVKPIQDVLKWRRYFRNSKFSYLIETEFFPKWLDILYMWLTSEPNYSEVNEWYKFWVSLFPRDLRVSPGVRKGFQVGRDLIKKASYLGTRAADELDSPVFEVSHGNNIKNSQSAEHFKETKEKEQTQSREYVQNTVGESTMKDVVEDFCMDNNLLFIPLRRAHEVLGHPLYRVTASASGRGGFMCYFEDEILWAQDKTSRGSDGEFEWEPIGVEEIGDLARKR
ncbi:GC-rich sequence DNA-binding factor-like protein-domain-containing protein [Dipodascopsis uninucleata]